MDKITAADVGCAVLLRNGHTATMVSFEPMEKYAIQAVTSSGDPLFFTENGKNDKTTDLDILVFGFKPTKKPTANPLRDQLICAALTGLLSNPKMWDYNDETIAKFATDQADAVMEARG
jgi:hypothetical protein